METLMVKINSGNDYTDTMKIVMDFFPKKKDPDALKNYFYKDGHFFLREAFTHICITSDGSLFPSDLSEKLSPDTLGDCQDSIK